MTAAAQIVHSVPGRMRIRVPAMRGNDDFFQRAAGHLARLEGVTQAQANSRTASILLLHVGVSSQTVGEWAEREALFSLAAQDQAQRGKGVTPWEAASWSMDSMDAGLKAATSGFLDVRSVVFVGLVAMAVRQISKGNFMAPAATLLWYALELVNKSWNDDRGG